MSDGQQREESRADRIARYKEQRRQQLNIQVQARLAGEQGTRRLSAGGTSSQLPSSTKCSPDGPRTTKTSRLRAAAADASSPRKQSSSDGFDEKQHSAATSKIKSRTSDIHIREKDKSSKRKSNLNRSRDSEEIPAQVSTENGESASRSQSAKTSNSIVSEGSSSLTSLNDSPHSPTSKSLLVRKSQLAVHMENARKGLDLKPIKSYPKMTSNSHSKQETEKNSNNKENLKRPSIDKGRKSTDHKSHIDRLNEITAMTKETLARVEKLMTNKTTNLPTKKLPTSHKTTAKEKAAPSILKKKSSDDSGSEATTTPATSCPISILKRKPSQDDYHKPDGANSTPPVTFSPSVKEPATAETSSRKQGILKKRRSLDESLVLRRRSCSPEVASKLSDSKSILKTQQRRSSLEELSMIHSPDSNQHIQGILKRRTSKTEEEADQSFSSPQGILKRRSGASSAGSSANSPHVSITTAVILAAASGAEIVLDPPENPLVRPILKKKSISEDHQSTNDTTYQDVAPRPILKKKHGVTDDTDTDERLKPILKSWSRSSTLEREPPENHIKFLGHADDESEIRPILKQHRDESPKSSSRLSFCDDDTEVAEKELVRKRQRTWRSHTVTGVVAADVGNENVAESRRERPLSVSELVKSFEKATSSTGAIPKKSRYRTQPVTSDEYVASLLYVSSPSKERYRSNSANESFDNFLSSTFCNTSLEADGCPKVSSDSAFQSLVDGLEMEESFSKSTDTSPRSKHFKDELAAKLKAKTAVESAKPIKVSLENIHPAEESSATQKDDVEVSQETKDTCQNEDLWMDIDDPKKKKSLLKQSGKLSRHSTQPVTFEELHQASKLQPDDPSHLSLSERIRLFNQEIVRKKEEKGPTCSSSGPSPVNIPDITYDEGISSNDSGSDSDVNANMEKNSGGLCRSFSTQLSKFNGDSVKSSSESETSSGGREVSNILGANRGNIKQALESLLSKSQSQSGLAHDRKVTVRRSKTFAAKRTAPANEEMSQTIAELQATLQQKGESEWRKRYDQTKSVDDDLKFLKENNKYNVELSEKTSILDCKKDELDAASKRWRCRVEKSDAEKFSVSGKMEKAKELIPLNIPAADSTKKAPIPRRFSGKEKDFSSTPTSPEKNGHLGLKRSISNPDPCYHLLHCNGSSPKVVRKNVSIVQPDDFTFTNFYKNIDDKVNRNIQSEVESKDFDLIENHDLLVQKKNVQMPKKRVATKNPIKALAQREDIKNEYTEVLTGLAEREMKRLNIEKLAISSSNFAVEALAGLASREDFKSVPLKKASSLSTLLPYKELMLLQVKGRRHVQLRLVEPVAASVNQGDCYVLIANGELYTFIGPYSNVIEQSRAADVANFIQKTNDLGCKVPKVITIDSVASSSNEAKKFWSVLGSTSANNVIGAGNPAEDEIYEANMLLTNMVYRLEKEELVPVEEYWGVPPKYEMLTSTAVFLFDFGAEMYIWSGKNANATEKRKVLKLAKELWDDGYNYSECAICPVNVSMMLGDRKAEVLPTKANSRPEWALLAKVTQHGETILFKEKFLDWPDFSKIIRVKRNSVEKIVDPSYDIKPINVAQILTANDFQPDIVIEGNHLGRGDVYSDPDRNKIYQYDTLDVKVWRTMENIYEIVHQSSFGQFYDADSYIVRWKFRVNVRGQMLDGKPSKYTQVGRDLVIYFYWQGRNASINEKGLAALLTVELDSESAPQIRVSQGNEPAAFLRLFKGAMVVHKGKMGQDNTLEKGCKLFISRGEIEEETYLLEVSCKASQLRSRSSLVLWNTNKCKVTIWHGCKSTRQTKKAVNYCVQKLLKGNLPKMSMKNGLLKLEEIDEGQENADFKEILGTNQNTYLSLSNSRKSYDYTPRFFGFSSVSGTFSATEIPCSHKSEYTCPFPVSQDELYSASQPALFLIDNGNELWLWQGWWPEIEEGGVNVSDQTGSGAIRWQAERKAAMKTAINYWKTKHGETSEVKGKLVWAGLEPREFQNLFPVWEERKEIAELNLKEGKQSSESYNLEEELALLSRSEFPLARLLERPLPEGVDPTRLEEYLSSDDFKTLLGVSKNDFHKLPSWKQTALKKQKGLF